MAIVRHLQILNFRSVSQAEWFPQPGLNCLIGPGDAGKSTFLDAIDLALSARRTYAFSDADFHLLDTSRPIQISVTLGELDGELKNLEMYGRYLRGFNAENQQINDEPQHNDEIVITLRMTVGSDLDPDWSLYSERADAEGQEKRLPWRHRELLTPTRLGVTSQHHLAWGNSSILNKLSAETLDVSATLAGISRRARQDFAAHPLPQLSPLLTQVQAIGNTLGVPLDELKALLDVKGLSLSNGAISLHTSSDIPLRMLGTGSSRLLITGLQKAVGRSGILLVDEAEYGLEPYRISRLLQELGAKAEHPTGQVFITTHSPYVLRELKSSQLSVLRTLPAAPAEPEPSHRVLPLGGGDEEQATLRACAEAFFSKAVIVGEGRTEVGLVRGLDLFWLSLPAPGFQDRGVYTTDGDGGDKYFRRATVFARLGYKTALLKDSDITDDAHRQQTEQCQLSGVTILEWGAGKSTEAALFSNCPLPTIPKLLNLAVENLGEQQVNQHILNCSENLYTLQGCIGNPADRMRQSLAVAAGKYKWFKSISVAESLGRSIVGPDYANFGQEFKSIINSLYSWGQANGDRR
uniref:ATP-dependent nuclease n=1 Tax=Yersiniaceae TaxID=1903411 RepID=UPI001F4BE11D|nr:MULTISPECIES: ATP-binding protein [Yersiniaceae]ULG17030.1 hypothetical protein 1772p2_00044 [Serratia proteamaculans]ULG20146.1 hypothetical protein 49p3_00056 [Yersinia frederiksenii]